MESIAIMISAAGSLRMLIKSFMVISVDLGSPVSTESHMRRPICCLDSEGRNILAYPSKHLFLLEPERGAHIQMSHCSAYNGQDS